MLVAIAQSANSAQYGHPARTCPIMFCIAVIDANSCIAPMEAGYTGAARSRKHHPQVWCGVYGVDEGRFNQKGRSVVARVT